MQLCVGKVPNIYMHLGVDQPVGQGKVDAKPCDFRPKNCFGRINEHFLVCRGRESFSTKKRQKLRVNTIIMKKVMRGVNFHFLYIDVPNKLILEISLPFDSLPYFWSPSLPTPPCFLASMTLNFVTSGATKFSSHLSPFITFQSFTSPYPQPITSLRVTVPSPRRKNGRKLAPSQHAQHLPINSN